ncbi:hypothetical protein B0H14DRAFT_2587321 [Mycena olivaceomarginata]|nr:hypothetical protein B0H14DRAFT_2587321 [Mycena olivaceomarginata]
MADTPNSPHPSEPSPRDYLQTRPEIPLSRLSAPRRSARHTAWEDEDKQLAGLGTTTHRSRNRRAPVIPVRKHRRVEPGVNVHATARKHRGDTTNKMQNLAADLDELEVEHEEHVKEVRRQMLSSSAFKTRRKASLYNTKISHIMRDLNEDPEVKRMVTVDPSMLEGFTPEEEEMMADLVAKRKRKYHGKRANNLAASGMRSARLSATSTHVVPVTIQSWGALDFFCEVLKKDSADISTLFELWAVNRELGETGSDTLIAMQQECTAIIKAGLRDSREDKGRHELQKLHQGDVEGKTVGLVGWPKGVDFKCMSKQSAMGPPHPPRRAKCGTCKSKFKEMVKNGEAHEKKRRMSAPLQDPIEAEESGARAGIGDDDEQEDESRPCKAIANMSPREAGSQDQCDGKRGPAKTTKRKRDERADDDDDEWPTRKKHARAGEDESSHPRRIQKRSDCGDGDKDEAGGGRKKKHKSDDAPRTKAASKTSAPPAPPRPKPKPKPRVAALTAGNPKGPHEHLQRACCWHAHCQQSCGTHEHPTPILPSPLPAALTPSPPPPRVSRM